MAMALRLRGDRRQGETWHPVRELSAPTDGKPLSTRRSRNRIQRPPSIFAECCAPLPMGSNIAASTVGARSTATLNTNVSNTQRSVCHTNLTSGWVLGLPPRATHSATALQLTSNDREGGENECPSAGNAATHVHPTRHTSRDETTISKKATAVDGKRQPASWQNAERTSP